jgi:HK97 family phage major capsid protein
MLTVKELVASAKAAIVAGDMEAAKKYQAQAEALKAIEAIEPVEVATVPTNETPEFKALLAKFSALEDKLNAEPAQKAGGHLVVTEDETDKKAAKPWLSFGEQLVAVARAANNPRFMDERLAAQKAILGHNEQQPSEGGFLVQSDYAANIMTIMHESGDLISRVRRIPISANSNGFKMNAIDETNRSSGRWGGVQGYWVSEGGSITSSNMKFRQTTMELNKVAAALYATEELLQDGVALEALANQAIPEELTWLTSDAIFGGDGAGKPSGFLNANATVSVPKETGQAAATLMFENIIKMWARMWAPSRRNAVWLINQDVETQLMSMEFPIGTGGVPVFLPPGGLSGSPYGTLLGRPIIPTEYNPTLGTKGDIALVDLSQYLLIEKGGIQSASSMHVQFLTDQMVYKFTYRVDGQPSWYAPLTPAKGSNTLSPFVVLATRA